MTEFELYVLILCLIVYVALISVFTLLTVIIARQSLRLIRLGAEDERIAREHSGADKKKNGCFAILIDRGVSFIICILLILCFCISLTASLSESGACCPSLPSIRVVKSSSMATREESNKYLFDNNLTDQIQTFDLILTHSMPREEELELYDIVVYEVNGEYIIHRIVGIEEPSEKHPDERYFLLQGDAVRFSDKFPVKYDQMLGIYRGERVPAIGSFVAFMQSPAGWLCLILALFVLIAVPLIERKFKKEELQRLALLKANDPSSFDENTDTTADSCDEIAAEPEIEPKSEPKIEPEIEPESEPKIEPEADEPLHVINGQSVQVRYRTTFASRLIQSPESVQNYYTLIKNHILSYRDIKARASWSHESFNKGRTQLVKLNVKGKNLQVYLALDPEEYKDEKDSLVYVGDKPKLDKVPLMIRVKSDRTLKYALNLIDGVMKNNGIEQGEIPNVDYHVPYETTEALVKRKLIKVIIPTGVAIDGNTVIEKVNVTDILKEHKESTPKSEALAEPEALSETKDIPESEIIYEPDVKKDVEMEPSLPQKELSVNKSAQSKKKKGDIKIFLSRLSLLSEECLGYYNRVVEGLEQYKEFKCSYSKTYRNFSLLGVPTLRLAVRGHTLYCYLSGGFGFEEKLKTVSSFDPSARYPYCLAVSSAELAELVLNIISSIASSIPKGKAERRGEVITVVENGTRHLIFRYIDE